MTKNIYEWEQLTEKEMEELKVFAPEAVIEERIIIKRRIVRKHITNMLRAGVKVPGIRLTKAPERPTFLGKGNKKP